MSHPLVVNIRNGDDCDVNIMRPHRWGNPFVAGGRTDWTREEAIYAHHQWLMRGVAAPTADLYQLRGKVLGCCCAPKPCHGDTLARMANNPFVLKAYSRLC